MYTIKFWKKAAERAIKSAAQVAVLVITTGAVTTSSAPAVNAWLVDWKNAAGMVLGGAVLSLCTSIGSAPFGEDESPSLVK